MDKKLTNADEIEIAKQMLLWTQKMPTPGQYLRGQQFENSQMMRLEFLLMWIGQKRGGAFYEPLASMTSGERGKQYITKKSESVVTPLPLSDGWYLEGTMSLAQKLDLLGHLTKFGWSTQFLACAKAFVAGGTVREWLFGFDEGMHP